MTLACCCRAYYVAFGHLNDLIQLLKYWLLCSKVEGIPWSQDESRGQLC